MSKLGLLKVGTELVVSIGVSAIVGSAINQIAGPNLKLPKKLAVGVGGVVLSGMIADMATTYADVKIDEYVEIVTRVFTGVKLSDGAETIVVAPPEENDEPEEAVLTYRGIIVNDEVTFETEKEAKTVKNEIVELIRQTGFASFRDFYIQANVDDWDLRADVPSNNDIGWNTVKGFWVSVTRAGYTIKTPDPVTRPTKED